MLPYFAATEWLLRGSDRAWLPLLGKLLTLALFFAAAFLDVVPRMLLYGVGIIVPAFLLLEAFAHRFSRTAPGPWVPALVQSAWIGLALAATFPVLAH